MPDPYAPAGPPRTSSETVSVWDGFAQRLRRLGATEADVAALGEAWDDFASDPDWTPERRAELLRMGDRELRAHIAAVDDEWDYHHTTEDEAAAREAQRRLEAVRAEAFPRVNSSVQAILDWVGDDVTRAHAVLYWEDQAPSPRVTLQRPLRELTEAAF